MNNRVGHTQRGRKLKPLPKCLRAIVLGITKERISKFYGLAQRADQERLGNF